MNLQLFWHKTLRRPYRLHVSDSGGAKPVVVLLHGIAASGEDWQPLVAVLSARYRCITIDLVGFGKSPKPQWYAYQPEDHLRCLRATLRRLHIRRYILVGHSLGSLLATRYARQHHRSLRRLVLLSPPVYPPLPSILSRPARYQTNLFLHIYKILRSHPRMTPTNFRRLSRVLPLPKSVITHPETWIPFRRTLERCIETQTIGEDIVDIPLPIDIFYGTLDQVVVAANVEGLAKLHDVTIHTMHVNHSLGKRYQNTVATFLLSLA